MSRTKSAFVLGGCGHLGAHEVGMPRALAEHDVVPELVVGTSIGAIMARAQSGLPAGHAERIDWLFGCWRSLDAWVDERRAACSQPGDP